MARSNAYRANNFVERMADAKARAQDLRNRGISTAKILVLKRAPIAVDSFAGGFEAARYALRHDAGMAQEDYRRAVFPERYEDDICPGFEWMRQ